MTLDERGEDLAGEDVTFFYRADAGVRVEDLLQERGAAAWEAGEERGGWLARVGGALGPRGDACGVEAVGHGAEAGGDVPGGDPCGAVVRALGGPLKPIPGIRPG